MLISLSVTLSGTAPSRAEDGGVTPPNLPQIVTLDAFSRDRALFDGDMANGNDSATIPVSGTADPGAAIEARILTETGGEVEGWTQIATADGSGTWSGTVETGRHAAWLRPQVRLAANPSVQAIGAHRFGVGLIVFYSRQSNGQRLFNIQTFASDAPTGPGPIDDADAFQMITIDGRGAPNDEDNGTVSDFLHIGPSNFRSRPVQEMASILTRNAPGLKVLFVVDVKPGAAMHDTLQGKPERKWSKVQEMVDRVTADGAQIGAFIFNHANNMSDTPAVLAENMGRLLLDKEPDGTPFRDPVTGEGTLDGGGGANDPVIYTWPDMFPGLLTGRTRILCGPEYYMFTGNETTGYRGEAQNQFARTTTFEKFIGDWSDPAKYDMGSVPPPILTPYAPALHGYPNQSGGLEDSSHFTSAHDLGAMEAARATMALTLNAAGALTFGMPRIDNVTWHADYVRIRSTAGPWTTYAHEQSMDLSAELTAAGLAKQQALGVSRGEFDFPYPSKIIDPEASDPVTAPHVGKGDIIVMPPQGETFDSTSFIQMFRHLGYVNPVSHRDDHDWAQYLRPVIDVGVTGWAGATPYLASDQKPIMVDPATGQNLNTLPPPATTGYLTPSNHDGWAADAGNLPAGTTQITFETRLRYLPGNEQTKLFWIPVGDWPRRSDVRLTPDGAVSTAVSRVGVFNPIWTRSTPSGVVPDTGELTTLRVALDLERGNVRVFVNGTEYSDAHHGDVQGLGTQGSGFVFERGQNLVLGEGRPAEYEYIRVWFTAEADGSTPAGTPDYEVLGTDTGTFDTSGGGRSLSHETR